MPKEIKRYKILCECDDNTEWVKYSDHLEAVENLKGSMEEHLLYISVNHEDKLKEAIQAEREEFNRFLTTVKQHIVCLESKAALTVAQNAIQFYEERARSEE